jgi:hypothetical protein
MLPPLTWGATFSFPFATHRLAPKAGAIGKDMGRREGGSVVSGQPQPEAAVTGKEIDDGKPAPVCAKCIAV